MHVFDLDKDAVKSSDVLTATSAPLKRARLDTRLHLHRNSKRGAFHWTRLSDFVLRCVRKPSRVKSIITSNHQEKLHSFISSATYGSLRTPICLRRFVYCAFIMSRKL